MQYTDASPNHIRTVAGSRQGDGADAADALGQLEEQLEKLRARCSEYNLAQTQFADRLAETSRREAALKERADQVASREQQLQARLSEIERRENTLSGQLEVLSQQERSLQERESQMTSTACEQEDLFARREESLQEREQQLQSAMQSRERALADQESTLAEERQRLEAAAREEADRLKAQQQELLQREQALEEREQSVAALSEALALREQEFVRVKAKISGIRHVLNSISNGGAAGRGEDIEALISSTVRRAVDAQREADQTTVRLQSTQEHFHAEQRRADAAEKALARLSARAERLERELCESQTLCTRVQSDMEALTSELRSEIKRIAAERDRLQKRLEQQEARLARAGLEIHWIEPPKQRKRKGR